MRYCPFDTLLLTAPHPTEDGQWCFGIAVPQVRNILKRVPIPIIFADAVQIEVITPNGQLVQIQREKFHQIQSWMLEISRRFQSDTSHPCHLVVRATGETVMMYDGPGERAFRSCTVAFELSKISVNLANPYLVGLEESVFPSLTEELTAASLEARQAILWLIS